MARISIYNDFWKEEYPCFERIRNHHKAEKLTEKQVLTIDRKEAKMARELARKDKFIRAEIPCEPVMVCGVPSEEFFNPGPDYAA